MIESKRYVLITMDIDYREIWFNSSFTSQLWIAGETRRSTETHLNQVCVSKYRWKQTVSDFPMPKNME